MNTEELHEMVEQYLDDAIDHGATWESLQNEMAYYHLLLFLDEYGMNEEDVHGVYL